MLRYIASRKSDDMGSDEKDEGSNRNRPISRWWEEETIDGKVVRCLTIILRSRGCTFAKSDPCTMCGYNNDTCDYIEIGDIPLQIKNLSEDIHGANYIKIFTSGSFLDPSEIDPSDRMDVLASLHDLSPDARVLVESRPEFVDEEVLSDIKGVHPNMEIAFGLESSDDIVRTNLVGKTFSFKEYKRASDLTRSAGFSVKTYLLLKPPFLSEYGSIRDAIGSIGILARESPTNTISVNPVNVQKGTVVEDLFHRGEYRPPWLWSLISVLRLGKQICGEGTRLISHPTGGGRRRGAHNCSKCDAEALSSISRFDLSQDVNDLIDETECCSGKWRESLLTL